MSRQAQLRSLILKAKQAYYYRAKPIMTDAEYDALEDELRLIDPSDPVLFIVGAPIPPDAILTKAAHRIPMGSQGKVNSSEQYVAWHEKNAQGHPIHASLKGDGASAAAYYENGRLVQVVSRGDGQVGEDVTANAVNFKGLPAFAAGPEGPFTGAVRFEVILTVDDWGKVDPQRTTNPRNMGTGIMGRKNGEQSELLTVFAFDIDESREGKPVVLETEHEKSKRLEELGFNLIEYEMCETAEQVVLYFEQVKRKRDSLPIWIDGVVLKIDDIGTQQKLGVTGGRPKGQIAWKFDSEGASTELLEVSISGGHTGALIPNARFAPVKIGGTTVQNASLSNWEEVKRLGLAIGDRIWVIKANDIIPKVVRVVAQGESRQPIPIPSTCPFCDGPVSRKRNKGGEEGAVLECTNTDCPKKSTGKIKRWIKSLDILGIGDSVCDAMVEQLELADISDLYTLREDPGQLAALIINAEKEIRLGEKRANAIIEAIEATRDLSLVQFLGSLGIEQLGKRRVHLIVLAAVGKLSTLSAWRSGVLRDPALAQQVGVPGIGDAIQDDIDAMPDIIDSLLRNGVQVRDVDQAAQEDAAAATAAMKTVCITGKLPSGKKKADYAAPLLTAGYQLVDDVSAGLGFLVMAEPDSTSGKAKKAAKLGIKLISEEDLQGLLK